MPHYARDVLASGATAWLRAVALNLVRLAARFAGQHQARPRRPAFALLAPLPT